MLLGCDWIREYGRRRNIWENDRGIAEEERVGFLYLLSLFLISAKTFSFFPSLFLVGSFESEIWRHCDKAEDCQAKGIFCEFSGFL